MLSIEVMFCIHYTFYPIPRLSGGLQVKSEQPSTVYIHVALEIILETFALKRHCLYIDITEYEIFTLYFLHTSLNTNMLFI